MKLPWAGMDADGGLVHSAKLDAVSEGQVGHVVHASLRGIGRSARAEALLPLTCMHAPLSMALTIPIRLGWISKI